MTTLAAVFRYLPLRQPRAARSHGDWLRALWARFQRGLCGLHGHDDIMRFAPHRLYLECLSCGRCTTGCDLRAADPPGVRSVARTPSHPRDRVAAIGARTAA